MNRFEARSRYTHGTLRAAKGRVGRRWSARLGNRRESAGDPGPSNSLGIPELCVITGRAFHTTRLAVGRVPHEDGRVTCDHHFSTAFPCPCAVHQHNRVMSLRIWKSGATACKSHPADCYGDGYECMLLAYAWARHRLCSSRESSTTRAN